MKILKKLTVDNGYLYIDEGMIKVAIHAILIPAMLAYFVNYYAICYWFVPTAVYMVDYIEKEKMDENAIFFFVTIALMVCLFVVGWADSVIG